ncbi:hypothetical protein THASP1DRAFT_32822 [Thamnocephalis sphaerospora]|uniref:FAS1 domain-containing protein n=1 Tax=Thamnocephalis sphaerospora TaxID=78915 RepID=A0A4P9XI46_9FUNG|nr:hypothetical protein THASP1DRAFT_32822 [Thamnocephalis sphaerospora]|eukprot:RKP05336.1 hypothetical protein THASP1DRAFT_32822 [Thamnocephalis sphaerospora]
MFDPSFTVFAPVNSPTGSLTLDGDVRDVVNYHIVGNSTIYDLSRMEKNQVYTIKADSGHSYVFKQGVDTLVNCAKIVAQPIVATDGVIYPIASPLRPGDGDRILDAIRNKKKIDCRNF